MEPMFSENLKKAMSQRGVSQKQLSNRTKISEGAISRWISGEREPSPENLIKLARALDVEYGEILSWFVDGVPDLEKENLVQRLNGYFEELGEHEQKDYVDALELRVKKGPGTNDKNNSNRKGQI